MLVLSRRIGEEIIVGDGLRIKMLAIKGKRAILGVVAPRDVPVHRREILTRDCGMTESADSTDFLESESAGAIPSESGDMNYIIGATPPPSSLSATWPPIGTRSKEMIMQSAPAERSPLRVLIAEDHDEFRRLLAESFRSQQYEVTECRHGVELIDHLRCLVESGDPVEYDLIISDIRMPGVTGLSVLEGLRECAHVPPIILITAFGDEETYAQGRLFGAAAVMDKPLDVTELLFQAHKIIERNASRPGQH